MSDEAKAELTKQLAALLGFDDGVDDVLQMLLTIEAKDDLKAYLDQLLGNDRSTLSFIENVERVKKGGLPFSEAKTVTSQQAPKMNTKQQSTGTKTYSKSLTTPRPQKIRGHIGGNVWDRRQLVKSSGTKKKNAIDASITQQSSAHTSERKDIPHSASQEEAQLREKVPKIVAPSRGTPTVVCGCFGNMHKPLANCLYCGRISCESEGYSYCGFCGYLVEKTEGDSTDPAWKHKERLLRYDRESTQRTVIIDDQADYYSSSAWLTATEEEEAKEMDQLRYDEQHRRGRAVKLSLR